MSSTHRDPLQQRALRRVKLKMGFVVHATVFVLVNLGLAAIDLATGGHRWHLWPLAGWGLGLAIHGIVTLASLQGEGLRERLLERRWRACAMADEGASIESTHVRAHQRRPRQAQQLPARRHRA